MTNPSSTPENSSAKEKTTRKRKHALAVTDLEVIQALADGEGQQAYAKRTGQNFFAVHARLQRARRFLKAKNTTHLIAEAVRKGLVD